MKTITLMMASSVTAISLLIH
jgi:hypothetical protein